jgi:hypothetical protein
MAVGTTPSHVMLLLFICLPLYTLHLPKFMWLVCMDTCEAYMMGIFSRVGLRSSLRPYPYEVAYATPYFFDSQLLMYPSLQAKMDTRGALLDKLTAMF